MLRLEGIRHQFGPTPILGGIDLTVAAGEIVCVIGASGCGKSTLLGIAGGLITPEAGRVENTFRDRAFVFQDPRLLPWRRVLDNVVLGRRGDGVRAEARRLLGDLGLGDWVDAYPHQLSGGMRQRVAIARALATAAPLLLLDEPFAALDPTRRRGLQTALRRRCRDVGRAALFVTHDLTEALALGDRVLVLGGSPARVVSRSEGLAAGSDEAEAFAAAAALLRRPAVRAAFAASDQEELP